MLVLMRSHSSASQQMFQNISPHLWPDGSKEKLSKNKFLRGSSELVQKELLSEVMQSQIDTLLYDIITRYCSTVTWLLHANYSLHITWFN